MGKDHGRRIRSRYAAFVICLCLLLLSRGYAAHKKTYDYKKYLKLPNYSTFLSRMHATFQGPIRLPAQFFSPSYPQLLSVSDGAYEVIFAADASACQGQHGCSYGSIVGSTEPIEAETDLHPSKVHLAHGIEGIYYPTDCGAYCGEAEVLWDEAKIHYKVGIKAGSRQEVIDCANSTILAGDR